MAGRIKNAKAMQTVHKVAPIEGGSAHLVGIGNLRVMITKDDGSWFAQALEIDYAAQGMSLPDVKKRFEEGLKATIDEYLKVYGHISKLRQPAPGEVWTEWYNMMEAARFRFSQLSIHIHKTLRFQGIVYYEPKAA